MCLRLGEPRGDGPGGLNPPQILWQGRSTVVGARNPGVQAAFSVGHFLLWACFLSTELARGGLLVSSDVG